MDKVKKDLEAIISGLNSVSEKLERLSKSISGVKAAPKAKKAVSKRPGKRTQKAAVKTNHQGPTSLEVVLDLITAAKDGINTATLEKETGFNTKKVQNVIFKLKKKGQITTRSKGIYIPL